jgi:hypothetical protein
LSPDIIEQIIQEVPQDFHNNGSLSPPVLRRIAELHRQAGARVSAETGCGLTTLILSHLSERHTSFTAEFGDSLSKTRGHHLFNVASTSFIVNPTQLSLPAYRFSGALDLVILDGPHAYPFPDLEYFFFYPHVRSGGILIVDDIHIPTIGHMHDFLCDDEMWEHVGDTETTAFFRRTTAPLLDPYGDGWPSQRYNRRYFAYPQALDHLYGKGWYKGAFGDDRPSSRRRPESMQINGLVAEQECALLQGRLAAAQAELAAAQAELAITGKQLLRASSEVEALKNSTSWRLTAPLRFLKSMLRGDRPDFLQSHAWARTARQGRGHRKSPPGVQT